MAVVIFKPDFIGYCSVKKFVGRPLTITIWAADSSGDKPRDNDRSFNDNFVMDWPFKKLYRIRCLAIRLRMPRL